MEKNINIYQNRIKLYISELDKVDLTNPLCVLEWFYKITDALIMFEIPEVSNIVYQKLINNGYRAVVTEKDELKTIYSLTATRMINMDDLARNIIAIILKRLNEHKTLDISIMSFIYTFNEKFNSDSIFKIMMEKLKSNIGSRVVVNLITNNTFDLKVGVLNAVEDFVSVTIDDQVIPFIGNNIGINKICLNGNTLYNNSRVLPNVDLSNNDKIKELNEEIFKDNYRQAVAKVI